VTSIQGVNVKTIEQRVAEAVTIRESGGCWLVDVAGVEVNNCGTLRESAESHAVVVRHQLAVAAEMAVAFIDERADKVARDAVAHVEEMEAIKGAAAASEPASRETPHTCRAGGDGDCYWTECPQERDGGIHRQKTCPLLGASGERHPRHSEPGDEYAIPGAAPRETPACACRHAPNHVGALTEALGCPCGPSCPCIADETPAAPTGTARDIPTPVPLSWEATPPTETGHWWHRRGPGAHEHIVHVIMQLDHSLAVEERGRDRDFYTPVTEYGGEWLRAVPFVAAPPPPPAEPRAGESFSDTLIGGGFVLSGPDGVCFACRASMHGHCLHAGCACLRDGHTRPTVTPAPAPQPVAPRRCGNPTCYAHDGETCAKGAMQREECEEWQRGTPQPVSGEVATCPRCRAPVGSSDTAAIKGSREVCYWAAGQRSEAAYDECARRAGAQVARLTRMLDSMTDQQHRACLREVEQERRADAAEARVAELEAERATLDARLLDAVQSVPTSAGKE